MADAPPPPPPPSPVSVALRPRPAPAPNPSATLATGMIVTPWRSIGSPNAAETEVVAPNLVARRSMSSAASPSMLRSASCCARCWAWISVWGSVMARPFFGRLLGRSTRAGALAMEGGIAHGRDAGQRWPFEEVCLVLAQERLAVPLPGEAGPPEHLLEDPAGSLGILHIAASWSVGPVAPNVDQG